MGSLSVCDGLQAVCVSRSLCVKISALLATHVDNSGGSVGDSISLGEDSQQDQDFTRPYYKAQRLPAG